MPRVCWEVPVSVLGVAPGISYMNSVSSRWNVVKSMRKPNSTPIIDFVFLSEVCHSNLSHDSHVHLDLQRRVWFGTQTLIHRGQEWLCNAALVCLCQVHPWISQLKHGSSQTICLPRQCLVSSLKWRSTTHVPLNHTRSCEKEKNCRLSSALQTV